jgi:hypothetical protein
VNLNLGKHHAMGYDPSYQPSQRWFCGFPHLQIAREALAAAAAMEKPVLDGFGFLFLAKLEIKRSINAVLGLPLYGNCPLELIENAWREVSADLRSEIKQALECGFAVHYGGDNQYGVPNFFFRKGDESASLTGSGNQEIIREAFAERLAAVRHLMSLVIRLFGEIYITDKSGDLFYYGPFEGQDDEESFQYLESHKIVESAEEAMRLYNGDIGLAMRVPTISEAVHKVEVQYWLCRHDEAMWSSDEHEVICHSHGW